MKTFYDIIKIMKNIKTNLNLYKSFLEIYETKNYSVAAANLKLTQPTMSYNIRELEKQLKVRLFNTNSRGVEPTRNAEELYPMIRAAFEHLLVAEDTISDFGERSQGIVRLNVSLYFIPQIATELITKFNKKYPAIKFEITTASVADGNDALERHESDLMIFSYSGVKNHDASKFTVVDIMELENEFFATREFIKKHNLDGAVTLEQLATVPMISVANTFQISKNLNKLGLGKNPIVETNSTQMLVSLAKSDMGVIYGPAAFVGDLVKINVRDMQPLKSFIAIKYNNNIANKAGVAFIESIVSK